MVMAMTVFAAGITEDRAKEIALENAKVSQEDISFIWTEVDYDHGRKIYDVEFFTKDYKEYDYEIDAENGTILEMDYDAEYELRDRREGRSRLSSSRQRKAGQRKGRGGANPTEKEKIDENHTKTHKGENGAV